MIVEKINDRWQLFNRSSSGMRHLINDVVIPDELDTAEIVRFLADIYHESASEKYPDVIIEKD